MQAARVVFDGPLRALFADEALLARCHFRLPDVTRLGRRLGFTPLTVDELARPSASCRPTDDAPSRSPVTGHAF